MKRVHNIDQLHYYSGLWQNRKDIKWAPSTCLGCFVEGSGSDSWAGYTYRSLLVQQEPANLQSICTPLFNRSWSDDWLASVKRSFWKTSIQSALAAISFSVHFLVKIMHKLSHWLYFLCEYITCQQSLWFFIHTGGFSLYYECFSLQSRYCISKPFVISFLISQVT